MPVDLTYETYQDEDKGIVKQTRGELVVSNTKFLEIVTNDITDIDLLPPGVFHVSDDRNFILLQEPPQERLVSIRHRIQPCCECDDYNEETEEYETVCYFCSEDFEDFVDVHKGEQEGWGTYLLPTPWIIYTLKNNRSYVELVRILTSPEEVTNYDQVLNSTPLPNIYNDGGICTGSADTSVFKSLNRSISHDISFCIESLWSSAFNYDVQEFLDTGIWAHIMQMEEIEEWEQDIFFKRWESLSIDEVLRLPWNRDSVCSVGDLVYQHTYPENRSVLRLYHWLRHVSVAAKSTGPH